MPAEDPERERLHKAIDDAEAEQESRLEQSERSIFTHRPDPGPIPDVLQKGPERKPAPPESGSGFAGMARAWAIALDFVFTILAGAGLGWLFDRWRGSGPVGLLVGLGLGFFLAFWRIIRTTQKQEREDAARRRGGGSA